MLVKIILALLKLFYFSGEECGPWVCGWIFQLFDIVDFKYKFWLNIDNHFIERLYVLEYNTFMFQKIKLSGIVFSLKHTILEKYLSLKYIDLF